MRNAKRAYVQQNSPSQVHLRIFDEKIESKTNMNHCKSLFIDKKNGENERDIKIR